MKELELKIQDKIEIVEEKQIKKEYKLLTTIKPHQGHQCFELNVDTGKINQAQYKAIDIEYDPNTKNPGKKRVIDVKERCLYTTALNVKNAVKRFKKMVTKIDDTYTISNISNG